jgi:hypothetical protein
MLSIQEVRGQDQKLDRDSRLGREILFLIANTDWIRNTVECVALHNAGTVETTIEVHLDLELAGDHPTVLESWTTQKDPGSLPDDAAEHLLRVQLRSPDRRGLIFELLDELDRVLTRMLRDEGPSAPVEIHEPGDGLSRQMLAGPASCPGALAAVGRPSGVETGPPDMAAVRAGPRHHYVQETLLPSGAGPEGKGNAARRVIRRS